MKHCHILVKIYNFEKEMLYFYTFLCLEHCPVLKNPRNGRVMVTGFSEGDTATYECHCGFVLDNESNKVQTCQENREWSNQTPKCKSSDHEAQYIVIFDHIMFYIFCVLLTKYSSGRQLLQQKMIEFTQ